MTIRTWGFDVTPDGTGATVANVKATDNTAASTVSPGAGGVIQFSTVRAHAGAASILFNSSATAGALIRLPLDNITLKTGAVSFYHYVGALVGTAHTICGIRHGSGNVLRVGLRSTGQVEIYNSAAASVAISAASVIAAGFNRFEVVYDSGTTTANGSVTVNVYNGDSTTAYVTVTASAQNLSSNVAVAVDIGMTGTAVAAQQWFDSVRTEAGRTTEIGPYTSPNTPPSVSLTGNQNLAAGIAATATATATDSDGTVASYAWTGVTKTASAVTATTLTNAATATCGLTTPAAGSLVELTCVVTDNNGASTTKTTEIRVPTTGNFTTLAGSGSGPGWVNTGGAATEGLALSDASDTTYVESPAYGASASARKWRLQPLTSVSGLALSSRTAVSVTGGNTLVRLLEGATMRQEWAVNQSTAINDQALTLTTPGAVSDPGDLWVEYSVAN